MSVGIAFQGHSHELETSILRWSFNLLKLDESFYEIEAHRVPARRRHDGVSATSEVAIIKKNESGHFMCTAVLHIIMFVTRQLRSSTPACKAANSPADNYYMIGAIVRRQASTAPHFIILWPVVVVPSCSQ
jgi:hypothetical protein